MENEDWVKRGNQIFYDSVITTQKEANMVIVPNI
jgi:hypothetical protein